MAISLRPAGPGDRDFAWRVQVNSIGPYVKETWGWDEESQLAIFEDRYGSAGWQVILLGAEPVGMLKVVDEPGRVVLASILLLPHAQGQGVGSELIRAVQERARAAGLPVWLRVLRVNPAQRLYRRLGFQLCGESDTHLEMLWETEGSPG